MKITKTQLKQIIKEELEEVLAEDMPRRIRGPDSVRQKSGFQGYATGKLADDERYGSSVMPSAHTPDTTSETEIPKAIKALLKKRDGSLSRVLAPDPSDEDLKSAVKMLGHIFQRYGRPTGAKYGSQLYELYNTYESFLMQSRYYDKSRAELLDNLKNLKEL